jgi:hypothetical protein
MSLEAMGSVEHRVRNGLATPQVVKETLCAFPLAS